MADMIGPFDSAPWSQTEWYGFAPTWAPSGIIGSPAASISAGDFAVTASGLNVTVACNGDRAWIDGSGYKPDTDKTLAVTANGNLSLSRRDRLVIRRDLAAKTTAVVRLAGTPASGTPAPPALTQVTRGVFELPVCSFLVPPNNGTALTGFIDERLWIDPSSPNLLVYSMDNRPTAGLVTSMTVRPLNRPAVAYTWNGTHWVPEGWPLTADTGGAPVGAYLRMEGGTSVVATNAAGAYSVPIPVMSAAPFMAIQVAGDTSGGLAYVRPTPGSYTTTGITGLAHQAGGTSAANVSIRVNWTVYGFST